MEAILEMIQPIIDTITGFVEGGIDFDSIIATITELLGGLIGG